VSDLDDLRRTAGNSGLHGCASTRAGSSRAPRSEDQPRREKRAKLTVPMVSIFIEHAASELHRKARTAKVLLARLTFWM
jgi:hypothetical protein